MSPGARPHQPPQLRALALSEGDIYTHATERVAVVATHIADMKGWSVRIGLDETGDPVTMLLARARDDTAQAEVHPLNSSLLAKLPLAPILKEAKHLDTIRAFTAPVPARLPAMKITMNRRGPSGRPEIEWAYIAATYVANHRRGGTIQTLAEQLDVNQSQARQLVVNARRNGFLSPTKQGRAGGRLTERAEKILRDGES